jgi:hypothetical protein
VFAQTRLEKGEEDISEVFEVFVGRENHLESSRKHDDEDSPDKQEGAHFDSHFVQNLEEGSKSLSQPELQKKLYPCYACKQGNVVHESINLVCLTYRLPTNVRLEQLSGCHFRGAQLVGYVELNVV